MSHTIESSPPLLGEGVREGTSESSLSYYFVLQVSILRRIACDNTLREGRGQQKGGESDLDWGTACPTASSLCPPKALINASRAIKKIPSYGSGCLRSQGTNARGKGKCRKTNIVRAWPFRKCILLWEQGSSFLATYRSVLAPIWLIPLVPNF